MTPKKKAALGRNLASMLSDSARRDLESRDDAPTGAGARLADLPIEQVRPGPYQPRSVFDADKLEELAASIRAQGVVQPIVVRRVDDGYELIAGERRWRAAQMAELDRVPAIVREVDDETTVAMALIENIQREDLNPLEEATALRRLIDEYGLTHQQCADAVGRSRVSVSNLLRLLDLCDEVKNLVDARHIEMGHARALLSLPDDLQRQAAREVIRRKLNVRQTEAVVRRLKAAGNKPKKPRIDPDILRLQDDLTEKLCARVRIQHGAGGKGKLVIEYNSADELDGIIDHLVTD